MIFFLCFIFFPNNFKYRIVSSVIIQKSTLCYNILNIFTIFTLVVKMKFLRSGYNIFLRREGVAPNYVINGLVSTDNSWIDGGKIRYDLLGKAMYAAGIDSGMTKSATQADGYKGQWSEISANFSAINKAGLLVYRVGYDSSMYSVYLRRDGTLPMTGSLNMGGNDINAAKNITASGIGDFGGNVTSGGVVTAAGEVVAHNGYGDTISLGGDAAGSDYEIRLATAKPLSIFSPNVPSSQRPTTTVFQTNGQMLVIGNQVVNNNISTNGFSYTDMPAGWSGIRTGDIKLSNNGSNGFYDGARPANTAFVYMVRAM
jgi:hypothetical protein